jgi:hypothetical protein
MISPYSAGISRIVYAFEGVIKRKEKRAKAKRRKRSFLAVHTIKL